MLFNAIAVLCSDLDESSVFEITVFKHGINKCYMSDNTNGFGIQVRSHSYYWMMYIFTSNQVSNLTASSCVVLVDGSQNVYNVIAEQPSSFP